MSKPFWIEDPNILISEMNFWPIPTMNKPDKFNSISRFIILLTIVGYIIMPNSTILVTGTVTLSIIILLYYLKQPTKEEFNTLLSPPSISSQETTKSTPTNPLSNIELPEIQFNPKRKEAQLAYGKEQEKTINKNTKKMVMETSFPDDPDLEKKLFKDLGDEIEFDRSMHNFYTTPNTKIPNDQDKFAQFCYGDMPSCKEGSALACEKKAFKYIPS
tara:strand:- start:5696 stop:6343 length:648 start_codon:yes stop_codon:yes gene_type:complete